MSPSMPTKRYPSQSQTRAEIMTRRLARGLCDACGGGTREMEIAGRTVRVCANPDADHGFHEVEKRDGAEFSTGRVSATVPAELRV